MNQLNEILQQFEITYNDVITGIKTLSPNITICNNQNSAFELISSLVTIIYEDIGSLPYYLNENNMLDGNAIQNMFKQIDTIYDNVLSLKSIFYNIETISKDALTEIQHDIRAISELKYSRYYEHDISYMLQNVTDEYKTLIYTWVFNVINNFISKVVSFLTLFADVLNVK